MLRAVIVDDERLARRDLRSALKAHANIEIVGEADTVESAVELIRREDPDVVFLDIQMPGESGFGLLSHLEESVSVVFVTAYDEYAVRAFEVNACDYLLKPVNPQRLARAVARLSPRERKQSATPENTSVSKVEIVKPLSHDDFIFIRTPPKPGFIQIKTIRMIRSAGDYAELHVADNTTRLVLKSLREWEDVLPQPYFLRIHRTMIVNIEQIERVEPWVESTYRIYLRGMSEPLVSSRSHSARLRERFKP